MAFSLTKNTRFGITANYYLLISVTTDKLRKTGKLIFFGYTDKATRMGGYAPIDSYGIDIDPVKFDQYFSAEVIENQTNQYQMGYKYAKENDSYFIDAVDLLDDEVTT